MFHVNYTRTRASMREYVDNDKTPGILMMPLSLGAGLGWCAEMLGVVLSIVDAPCGHSALWGSLPSAGGIGM